MEIEVGDYIRTKIGRIYTVKNIKTFEDGDVHIYNENYIYYRISDIAKHSKNIIDLIEAGDIIECITARINENMQCEEIGEVVKNVDARSGRKSLKVNKHDIHDVEIKRVLTHEQYEQNCFRI